MDAVLYVHGKGGSAREAAHYEPLFPGCKVVGLDYQTFTPWETGREIHTAAVALKKSASRVTLIANSIGAFFSLHADLDALVETAYFVSPLVDMEAMICGMMAAEQVTEDELRRKGTVPTAFGEVLSWEYLQYVRTHPVSWNVPTAILCGGCDTLVPLSTVKAFAEAHGASLTVLENGEHWFHTEEQFEFLDAWIKRGSLCKENSSTILA